MNSLRQRLIGAGLCLVVLCLLAALLPGQIPLARPMGTLARVLDSLAPQFLALSALAALFVALLGARRSGALALGVAVLAMGWFGVAHLQRSLPLERQSPAAFRLLFFNVLTGNDRNAENIAQAARAANADVLVFAEAGALRSVLPGLQADYPHMTPCAQAGCSTVVLSRLPMQPLRPPGNDGWNSRLQMASLAPEGHVPLTLVAAHLRKPWFQGFVEKDEESLIRNSRAIAGPLLVVGDFNAAPWARPMRRLLDETGLRAARVPVPTWPVGAGALGVPIDNMLVRGGARIVSLRPFGAGLGSNHLGLLAEVAVTVTPAPDAQTAPDAETPAAAPLAKDDRPAPPRDAGAQAAGL